MQINQEYKVKHILKLATVSFTFFTLFYLLFSEISYKNTTLLSAMLPNVAIQIINALVLGGVLVLTALFLYFNKEHFSLKITLGFLVGISIYSIYYALYGYLAHLPFLEIFSNIKTIVSILVLIYYHLFVINKIWRLKHIKVLNRAIVILIAISFLYAFIFDFKNIIDTYLSFKLYDYANKSLFLNKNFLGILIFLSIVIYLYLYALEHRKIYKIMIVVLTILNILSVCKTSIACELLLMIPLWLYPKNKSIKNVLTRGVLAVVFFIGIIILVSYVLQILNLDTISIFFYRFRVDAIKSFVSRFVIATHVMRNMSFGLIWLGNGYATSLVLMEENLNEAEFFHTSYIYHLSVGGIVFTLIILATLLYYLHHSNKLAVKNNYLSYLSICVFLSYCNYALMENVPFFSYSLNSLLFTLVVFVTPYVLDKRLKEMCLKSGTKNIAFITTIYPTEQKRWYGIYLKELAKSLVALGHKVTVLFITNEFKEVYQDEGVTIIPIGYNPYKLSKWLIPLNYQFKMNFQYVLDHNHFDSAIIHFYPMEMQNYIIDELKDHKIKVLHYLHSRNIWKREDEKHPLFRKLYFNNFYKSAYTKCDEIICVSQLVRNDFKQMPLNVSANVVYNGYNEIFNNDVVNLPPIDKLCVKIVSVGNLYSIKGHRYVLDALAELKRRLPKQTIQYDIIGSGVEKNILLKMREDLHLEKEVSFIEEMSQEELANRLDNYLIFVLPSYYEGLGCCYLEAMAKGLHVIGCRHQGIAEVINPLNGYLVEEHDSMALADIMEKIIKNCDSNNYMRINAIKRVQKLTWLNSAKELEKYL